MGARISSKFFQPEEIVRRDIEIHGDLIDGFDRGQLLARLPITYGGVAQPQILGELVLPDIFLRPQLFEPLPEQAAVECLHINYSNKN